MGKENAHDAFAYRVNYAARVISEGRQTSRTFDNCFENYDGDEVVVVLMRRAEGNPRLAANIWRYLDRDRAAACAARLAHVSTRDMPKQAAQTRADRRAEFNAWLDAKLAADEVARQAQT